MKDKEIIDLAIKTIEDGFKKMGGSVKNTRVLDKYLLVSKYKIFKFYKAIEILCKEGHTDEAMPILRSMIEHVINMRWILNKNTNERLKAYMNDLAGKKGFGASWTSVSLVDRMYEVGFKERAYFDFCVKVTYSYAHVNASSLNWYEVYEDERLSKKRWSADAIYPVIAQMFGHVIKVLGTHYKGYFDDPNVIWNKIKVDPNIREKIEKIKELSNK